MRSGGGHESGRAENVAGKLFVLRRKECFDVYFTDVKGGQISAYNHITAKKSIRIYPDFGHEWMPGHDDGVFQFLKDLL